MKNGKIVIDVAELMAEASAFRASAIAAERPEHRINKIIQQIRLFKAAVVRANIPRGYEPAHDRERLRAHRESACMPGTDIIRIKNWLSALDSKYLLGAEVTWRIDDSDWEVNIWTPLCKWSERGYAMLFDASDTKNWPQPISPGAIKSWEDDEQELEWQLSGRISIFLPTGDDVVLDETEPFTIRWRNQFCFLDNTDQFRIMERLVKAKGRKVSSEAIGEALNKDDFTDDALRKAISRLNAKLKKNGLEELANRIKTSESGRYAYIESAPS